MPTSNSSPPPPPTIEILSTETIKPPPNSSHSHPSLCHLTPWDLPMLCPHYIQKGLLFTNLPSSLPFPLLLSSLKSSLSLSLLHFFPLAGRLLSSQTPPLTISIDCNDKGASFTLASAPKISSLSLLPPSADCPSALISSLFPLNYAINYDGHSSPLLSVQLTLLAAGDLFLACSFNHAVGDGTSFWHFFNSWAELTRTKTASLSLPPLHARFFLDGHSPPIALPFSHPSQFLHRFIPPFLRERFFHFSPDSIAELKEKANREVRETGEGEIKISSFQALSALVWRAITRARGLGAERKTRCRMAIQNRGRLRAAEQHPAAYFGNSIYAVPAEMAAGELEEKGLGRAARELNGVIAAHTDEAIRGRLREYYERPVVYKMTMFDADSVMMGSSPRFDMYDGCDFGWGKAAAVRCGPANKFDGKVSAFPGREGGGSVDLEVCLLPGFMERLLLDPEFLEAVSGGQ